MVELAVGVDGKAMNLVLLIDADFINPTQVRFSDRRFEHIRTVLNSKIGDELCVGLLNGRMGHGKVIGMSEASIDIDIVLTQSPPEPLPLTLIIPMIRPPMFKRLLFHATTLGIKKIIVLNFNRVEKSLWNSSALRPQEMHDQMVLGLEQAKDTILPQVIIKDRFKPFVEDELPALSEGITVKIVAHPGTGQLCPTAVKQAAILVIGPEGGLVDYEIDKLKALNFQTINLGQRILRVETALPYIIGKMF